MIIIGVGECMIELSQADGGLLRKSFAGDVFNTLYYAAQSLESRSDADWKCGFFSAVGDDPTSKEMRAFIGSQGIDVSNLLTAQNRRPGLYMIHLDGAERTFSYWRDSSAAKHMMVDRAAAKTALERADVIYFSGITLAILPADDRQFFLDFVTSARNAGKLVVFDPNIRPALWPDRDELAHAIRDAGAASSIVLPSLDDERSAFGDAIPQETGERYLSYGAALVVVKNGPDEVMTFGDDGKVEIFATKPVNNAVDTTGAGDSFNGAFLAEYLRTGDVGQSVKSGQNCAARVISVYGALVPKDG